MLRNARVTVFTVYELLMQNQQGGGVFFSETCEIFKNTNFEKHLGTTASDFESNGFL